MTKSGCSLLMLIWIKGKFVLDLLLVNSALIIKKSLVGENNCIMLKTRGKLSRY